MERLHKGNRETILVACGKWTIRIVRLRPEAEAESGKGVGEWGVCEWGWDEGSPDGQGGVG